MGIYDRDYMRASEPANFYGDTHVGMQTSVSVDGTAEPALKKTHRVHGLVGFAMRVAIAVNRLWSRRR